LGVVRPGLEDPADGDACKRRIAAVLHANHDARP
jgi:hypothetical protein